jgi:glycerol transport system ATP-binding protein
VKFDGRDVTTPVAPGAQHRAGVPVPGHLRHHDGGREPGFPLRNRKVPKEQIKERVGEIAEMLEMSHQLEHARRRPGSADQKQKISLGRGLVRSDVSAVLFDEPLTVIDPHLKWQLRRKLKQIHHELKLTLIYVTHDQVEALTFADEVVVMTRGKAVQVGPAEADVRAAAHTFVGHFIGSPGMNFLPADEGDRFTCWHDPDLPARPRIALPAGESSSASVRNT